MNKWISVKDRLPNHQQTILCYSKITPSGKSGFGVSIFINSSIMNEDLRKTPYAYECVDISKYPYYFVSQEVKQHTYKHVTHWMPLPDSPEDELNSFAKKPIDSQKPLEPDFEQHYQDNVDDLYA